MPNNNRKERLRNLKFDKNRAIKAAKTLKYFRFTISRDGTTKVDIEKNIGQTRIEYYQNQKNNDIGNQSLDHKQDIRQNKCYQDDGVLKTEPGLDPDPDWILSNIVRSQTKLDRISKPENIKNENRKEDNREAKIVVVDHNFLDVLHEINFLIFNDEEALSQSILLL